MRPLNRKEHGVRRWWIGMRILRPIMLALILLAWVAIAPAHMPLLVAMAAGDVLLDASGNVILDDDGNVMLDDGADNSCCCACAACDGCDPGPCTATATISGVTLCSTCHCTSTGPLTATGSIDGTYDLVRADGGGFCLLQAPVTGFTITEYTPGSCTTPTTTLTSTVLALSRVSSTSWRVEVMAFGANMYEQFAYPVPSNDCTATISSTNDFTSCTPLATTCTNASGGSINITLHY